MGKYEDGEGRFWMHVDPKDKPYGENTLGIVDEEEGGIVIFVGCEMLAQKLLGFLIREESR